MPPFPVNKPTLVAQILTRLDADSLRYAAAAREAQAGATDEQSRAEHKYDTRGLEASYLAHGQSRQAQETARAREQFAALSGLDFGPDDPIGPGALIELGSDGGESAWYFLGPAAGGMEVLWEGREVLVITAQSPLGRRLVGKRQGERVETAAADGGRSVFRVATVR